MGNSLRCCLACVLPCGALDLIRIVHLNGYVEEITGPVTAGEILRANPNHVLSKPFSQGVVRGILVLSPESELKRGSIYFLIPATSSPEKKKSGDNANTNNNNNEKQKNSSRNQSSTKSQKCYGTAHDAYRKHSSSRHDHRRSGRVGVWRPHLQTISED